jgi:hypothetical protein
MRRLWRRDKMKFECRKCKLIFDAITWEDVEELQNLDCGRYGKHRILGVIE